MYSSKWLTLRLSHLGVKKHTQMCIFCYRALLYNFVIKFKYRCLSHLVWGDDTRGSQIVNAGKQQATCTEALLMEVLGPPALCCDLPEITRVHWDCGAECEGDSRANGKHRVKLFTAPL